MKAPQNDAPTHPVGTRVRVSLPDPEGPDGDYDGRTATVVSVDYDGLGELDGREELNEMYTLEFENGDRPSLSFRVHDLEPAEE